MIIMNHKLYVSKQTILYILELGHFYSHAVKLLCLFLSTVVTATLILYIHIIYTDIPVVVWDIL